MGFPFLISLTDVVTMPSFLSSLSQLVVSHFEKTKPIITISHHISYCQLQFKNVNMSVHNRSLDSQKRKEIEYPSSFHHTLFNFYLFIIIKHPTRP